METLQSLHELLQSLYTEMLPLSESLINPARAIGGLGALLYISFRIWEHMAKAEAIDFFPLFRPLALGLIIAAYPFFLEMIEGIMKPTISATESMVSGQHNAIIRLNEEKEKALASQSQNAKFEDNDQFKAALAELGVMDVGERVGLYLDKMTYEAKKSFRLWIKNLLELFYHAAGLAINTVRTFFLIVLAIIGPIALGLSIFPGFERSMSNWIGRYITVYLWLPISHVFGAICGKIQVLMLESDLATIQAGEEGLVTADYGYLIFLVIAIAGYFTIPTVAGWAVNASGVGSALSGVSQVGSMAAAGTQIAAGAATGGVSTAAGAAVKGAGAIGGMAGKFAQNLRTKS